MKKLLLLTIIAASFMFCHAASPVLTNVKPLAKYTSHEGYTILFDIDQPADVYLVEHGFDAQDKAQLDTSNIVSKSVAAAGTEEKIWLPNGENFIKNVIVEIKTYDIVAINAAGEISEAIPFTFYPNPNYVPIPDEGLFTYYPIVNGSFEADPVVFQHVMHRTTSFGKIGSFTGVSNFGFRENPDYFSIDTENASEGKQSLKIEASSGAASFYTDFIILDSTAADYEISFMAKASPTNDNGKAKLILNTFLRGDGFYKDLNVNSDLANFKSNNANWQNQNDANGGLNDNWKKFIAVLPAEAIETALDSLKRGVADAETANKLYFELVFADENGGFEGTYWVDDFRLHKLAIPADPITEAYEQNFDGQMVPYDVSVDNLENVAMVDSTLAATPVDPGWGFWSSTANFRMFHNPTGLEGYVAKYKVKLDENGSFTDESAGFRSEVKLYYTEDGISEEFVNAESDSILTKGEWTWIELYLTINGPLEEFLSFDNMTISLGTRAENGFNGIVYLDSVSLVGTDELQSSTAAYDISHISFNVYPTIVDDIVRIEADQLQRISIIDLTGAVRKNINVNSDNVSIDISTLKSGLYLIRVESNNGAGSKRFIKK